MHEVDNLVVISAIIDLLVVGGVVEVAIPGEVHGPGARGPLSHLVVVLDWRSWRLGLSNPVHDLIIIGGIVDSALRPALSPVGRLRLHQISLVDARDSVTLDRGESSNNCEELHLIDYRNQTHVIF